MYPFRLSTMYSSKKMRPQAMETYGNPAEIRNGKCKMQNKLHPMVALPYSCSLLPIWLRLHLSSPRIFRARRSSLKARRRSQSMLPSSIRSLMKIHRMINALLTILLTPFSHKKNNFLNQYWGCTKTKVIASVPQMGNNLVEVRVCSTIQL